jgi:hypothetical protein
MVDPRVRLCVFLSLFAAVAPPHAGLMGVNFDFQDSGVFSIDEAIGQSTLIGNSGASGLNALALHSNGARYSAARSSTDASPLPTDRLVTIDAATGAATVVATLTGISEPSIRALAFSPADVLFGMHHVSAENTIVSIDITSGQITTVGSTSASAGLQGLDFAADGTLYG